MARARERTNFTPSLAAAVALHLVVLLSGLIVWPWFGKPIQMVNATAVTLVSSASAPPPPALKAPEPQAAAAPEVTPTPAPPRPPPPQAAPQAKPQPPQPAPPKPQATPTPKPKPQSLDLNALATLDKSQAKPRPARDSLDLSALTSSLDKTARPQAATRGPPRAETALNARSDPGAAAATSDAAAAVGGRLNRIWNKSCGTEGFRDLVIQVRFQLSIDGQLVGQPQVVSAPQPGNPVWVAATDRAKRAVNQAAPFAELPRQTYAQWRNFTAIFDGKTACQNQ